MSEPPLCVRCGTCCFSTLDAYVAVTGDDHARLGERADDLVVFHGTRAFMRMHDGHCAALRVDAAGGEFPCSVYDRRPQTCRDLARGSRECAGEIATKADRPITLLARARRGGGAPDPAPS